jgi:hypothetical protein
MGRRVLTLGRLAIAVVSLTGIAKLAGWIDGDSAGGRMKVEGHADGQWTATRKP